MGPIPTPTPSGVVYSMTIVDEYSRACWTELLKSKDEAAGKIQEWALRMKNMIGRTPVTFHSDRGGEFMSDALQSFWKQHGTHANQSLPYTPQHNGIAERMNRTLVEGTRTMLIAAVTSTGPSARSRSIIMRAD